MDWLQIIVLLFGNVAWVLPLWLWSRSESRADFRQIDLILRSTDKKIEENAKDTRALIEAIREDMKDFHCRLALQDQEFKMRLCAIEERNRGK